MKGDRPGGPSSAGRSRRETRDDAGCAFTAVPPSNTLMPDPEP